MEKPLLRVVFTLIWMSGCGVSSSSAHQRVTRQGVVGVVGQTAEIPCEATPFSPVDAPYLILWYKDIFGTPIYSFDMRKNVSSGSHWMDRKTFDDRATFHIHKTGRKTAEGAAILKSYLRIEKLRKTDAGPYRCRVDFRQAPTRNVKVKLSLIELPERPQIYLDGSLLSADQTPPLKSGASLRLRCEVRGGSPSPTISWWRQDKKSSEKMVVETKAKVFPREQGFLISKLTLENLGRQDLGSRLGCSANNTDLVTAPETSFVVNMLLPPIRAKLVREWSYFVAGKTYEVSCQVQGSNPTAYTKGRIGSRELEVADFQTDPEGDISITRLSFVPSESDDGKVLLCWAENPHLAAAGGAVEDRWKIEVQYLPRVKLSLPEYPANKVSVREGDVLQLRCSVTANPKLHVLKWKKDGHLLEASSEITIANHRTEQKSASLFSLLTLESISPDRSGNYTCEAENLIGVGTSGVMEVRVKYRPICKRTGELVLFVGLEETVKLPCEVLAFPQKSINFQWTLLRTRARESPRYLSARDGDESIVENKGSRSVLTFRPRSTKDYGKVECVASNEVGPQQEPCVFQIKPKGLPTIEACQAAGFGPGWVTVSCKMTFNEGNDKLRVEIRAVTFASGQIEQNEPLANETFQVELEEAQGSDRSWHRRHVFNVSGLAPGNGYRHHITALVPSLQLESDDPVVLDTVLPLYQEDHAEEESYTSGADEEEEEEEELVVVVVEASTTPSSPKTTTLIPLKDPIRLLPVIGLLAVIVIILVLAAVLVVVVMRGQGGVSDSDRSLKTHVGFNRTLDEDIDAKGQGETVEKEPPVDKEILRNLETISKLDSYERLTDVKFEGFSKSSRLRGQQDPGEGFSRDASSVRSSLTANASSLTVEVPTAALCVIDDEQDLFLTRRRDNADPHSEDHFPFREAIQAPIAIRRLSQIVQTEPSATTPLIQARLPRPASLEALNLSSGVQTRDSWTSTTPRVTFAMDANKKMEYLL